MKRILAFLTVVALFVHIGPVVAGPSSLPYFTDLDKNHWAFQAVETLVRLDVLKGYADGTFRPSATMSRAEFAKVLVLAFAIPVSNPPTASFADVPASHWAFGYAEALRRYMPQVADGAYFRPDAVCSREDAAAMLVGVMGLDLGQADPDALNKFSDRTAITPGLVRHMASAVAHDIINGRPTNNGKAYVLNPQAPLTRAEAAALLARLIGKPAASGQSQTQNATVQSATGVAQLSSEERTLVDLINTERTAHGLKPLLLDAQLSGLARAKAKDLADHNTFSHDSPTYGSPREMLKSAGVKFAFAGENLADGTTASGALALWLGSKAHRDNVLNPAFTHIGIGISDGGQYGAITAAIFVKRN